MEAEVTVTLESLIATGVVGPGQNFDVREFGAAGNGTTDDTAAIGAAIVALTPGGTLFFPRGAYKTTGGFTISVPCTIMGEGSLAWMDEEHAMHTLFDEYGDDGHAWVAFLGEVATAIHTAFPDRTPEPTGF